MDKFSNEFETTGVFSLAANDGAYALDASQPDIPSGDEAYDLFRSFKGILIVGRILGIVPLSGVFKQSYKQLSHKRKSFAFLTSLIITSILTFNLVLALIQWVRAPKSNALKIAQSIHRTAQYCWGWLIYVTFLRRADKFLELFKYWAKVSSSVFYSVEDKSLRRDSILICALILISCILENATLHLEFFKELDYMNGVGKKYANVTNKNQSSLETYYWRSNSHWATIIGYNDFFAVLAFIQHKWMLYTWNYLDVLLAVFGRALYFKFKMLYKLSHETLLNSQKRGRLEVSKSSKETNKAAWLQVVSDHGQLYNLLKEVEDFFSHLVFGSYAVNVYYICMQLLIGLSPDITVTSIIQSIYGVWGFIHMAIRIYIVSLCVARINQYAHQIRRVLANCPIDIYQGEISRLDKRITCGPQVGLTGLGCFVVTKPFILSIVGVIFTFEIVLLQGTTSGPSAPASSISIGQCCCPSHK